VFQASFPADECFAFSTSLLGYISKANLRELLGENCSEAVISGIIQSADEDSDGQSKEFPRSAEIAPVLLPAS
jgi:hypothetical protein